MHLATELKTPIKIVMQQKNKILSTWVNWFETIIQTVLTALGRTKLTQFLCRRCWYVVSYKLTIVNFDYVTLTMWRELTMFYGVWRCELHEDMDQYWLHEKIQNVKKLFEICQTKCQQPLTKLLGITEEAVEPKKVEDSPQPKNSSNKSKKKNNQSKKKKNRRWEFVPSSFPFWLIFICSVYTLFCTYAPSLEPRSLGSILRLVQICSFIYSRTLSSSLSFLSREKLPIFVVFQDHEQRLLLFIGAWDDAGFQHVYIGRCSIMVFIASKYEVLLNDAEVYLETSIEHLLFEHFQYCGNCHVTISSSYWFITIQKFWDD